MLKFSSTIFILLLCLSTVSSQTIAITEDGKKVILNQDKTWEFLIEKPKEIKSDEIENIIIGDDLKELSKFVTGINDKLKKSEFETEEQYLKRLELIVTETKFNNKPLEDSILVIIPDLDYNAEEQEFSSLLFLQILRADFELVEWKHGYFSSSNDLSRMKFKITPEKAKNEKADIMLAIYGVPVGVNYRKLQFIPTKYVFYNKNSNEIYSEIETNM